MTNNPDDDSVGVIFFTKSNQWILTSEIIYNIV